jgi:outer membrane protein W
VKKYKKVDAKNIKKTKVNKKKVRKTFEYEEVKKGFSLGLGLGYMSVSDKVFNDVYGSGLLGIDFKVTYFFNNNWAAFLNLSYGMASGEFTILKDKTDVSMIPISLGVKYAFSMSGKFKPFVGAAVSHYNLKESNDISTLEKQSWKSNVGASLIAGTYYTLNDKISIYLDLKYDIIKFSFESLNKDLDFSGLRTFVGISYRFK